MNRLAALLLVAGAIGCAGARADVTAPTARYPISLTQSVRGGDGAIVAAAQRKMVGVFRAEKTAFAMLYSALPLTSALDLSDAVNDQVRAAGGDAVVNLTVSSQVCALDWFVFFHLLPIWPGCTTITARGTIVKALAGGPPPARDVAITASNRAR